MKINRNPEYFLTIARERNISRAAEKLYISQPYLSRKIIAIEEDLGVQLLDRSKSPLELTEAGQIYLRYLESCEQLNQKLALDLAAVTANQKLRLGLSSWRAGTLLPDILPLFSAQYPQVQLELFELPTSELLRLVRENKADFVVMNPTADMPADVTSETVLHEKILLAGNVSNPVTQEFLRQREAGEPLDLRLLEQQRLILLQPETTLAARVNNFLDKQQIVPRNFMYCASASTALNLTTQNYGFCFVNETGASRVSDPERLVFFDLNSPDLLHPLCVMYRKNSYLLPAARGFIDMMLQVYQSAPILAETL